MIWIVSLLALGAEPGPMSASLSETASSGPAARWGGTEAAGAGVASVQPRLEDRVKPTFGRPDVPDTLGRDLLWVPRIALAPVWAVERYVLYEPVRAAAIWVERDRIPVKVLSFLTLQTEAGSFLVLPIGFVDFGFRPSIGLMLVGQGKGEAAPAVNISLGYGGTDWYRANVKLGVQLPEGEDGKWVGSEVSASGGFLQRPDYVFFDYGPSFSDKRSRFSMATLGGELDVSLWRRQHVGIEAGVSTYRYSFGARGVLDDVPISSVVDTATLSGFEGYTALVGELDLTLDSRETEEQHHGSGLRLNYHQYLGQRLDDDASWYKGEAEGGVFLDLTGNRNVISLLQYVSFTSDLAGNGIPFTEAVSLGGNDHMRGFIRGRFRGERGWVSALQYTYRIWPFLEAAHFVELGGTPAGWVPDPADLSLSVGTGVILAESGPNPLRVTVGFGTAPVGDGFDVESFRFLVGNTEGF